MRAEITLTVDGKPRSVSVDTRTTVLDVLREHLGVTTAKKGCDHGQCGSCTVLVEGRRVTTCLSFAVAYDGAEITTADGLAQRGGQADGDGMHPVQQAFLDRDGFQCGYCTPGQVCSAVGMLDEVRSGWPSAVSWESGAAAQGTVELTDDEIRERMSGNLCRCGAYANIVDAIRESAT